MNQRSRAWLTMAHAALAVVLACYLVVVALNSLLFRYNFWNDPPPSDSADLFAVISLWALVSAMSFGGAVTYSWMCEFASDSGSGLHLPLRRAVGAALRRWWKVIPASAVSVLACVIFFPGIVAVALLGPLPVPGRDKSIRTDLSGRYGALTSMRIGAAVAFVASFTFWTATLVGSWVVSRFDGPIELVAAVLAYQSYLCSALAAGWAASAFSVAPAAQV